MNYDENRRYLEWLESSCFNIVQEHLGLPRDVILQKATSIIKLHAVFGGSIVVDNTSLLGSQIMLALFADEDFQRFIANNPSFIKLVDVYGHRKGAKSRRDLVMASFERAIEPDWISSTFPGDSIVRVGSKLLEADDIDPGILLSARGKGSVSAIIEADHAFADLLRGAVYSAAHFANQKEAPVAPGGDSKRVYEMLRDVAERPLLKAENRRRIEETISFLEKTFEDPRAASHSRIIRAAKSANLDTQIVRTILQTSSHAFNAGLEEVVSPAYGSYEFFPDGAPVGLYLGSLRDILVPTRETTESGSIFFRSLQRCNFDWSPHSIQWADVQKVLTNGRAVESAKDFQRAIAVGTPDEVREFTETHIKNLRPLLRDTMRTPEYWTWVIGGIAIIIGGGATAATGMPAYGVTAGSATWATLQSLVYSGYKYVAAEVVRDRAKKMVPRDQILDESRGRNPRAN